MCGAIPPLSVRLHGVRKHNFTFTRNIRQSPFMALGKVRSLWMNRDENIIELQFLNRILHKKNCPTVLALILRDTQPDGQPWSAQNIFKDFQYVIKVHQFSSGATKRHNNHPR